MNMIASTHVDSACNGRKFIEYLENCIFTMIPPNIVMIAHPSLTIAKSSGEMPAITSVRTSPNFAITLPGADVTTPAWNMSKRKATKTYFRVPVNQSEITVSKKT
jgi:hypothetical protein